MNDMSITLGAITLDAADLEVESTFWHLVLGGTVEKRERHHLIRLDGSPMVAIQLAPDHRPPQWPDGQPQQIHLDLVVDDIAAAHQQVVEAGATVLTPIPDGAVSPVGFRVYADPAGHPFCLCWGG